MFVRLIIAQLLFSLPLLGSFIVGRVDITYVSVFILRLNFNVSYDVATRLTKKLLNLVTVEF